MRLTRKRGMALAIAALVAADWGTKFLVANRIRLFDERSVVDGWLWLSHHENPGISWGWLAGLPDPWRTLLLSGLSLVGIALCVHLVASAPDRRVRWAAAFVLAGALGNLGDRLLDGSVTDFIRVEHFPYVFNVADVAITVGAFVLGALLALDPRARGEGDAAPV